MELLYIPSPRPPCANTFLLFAAGGHAVAVDPDAAPQAYLDALAARGASLSAIFLTHGHYDHVGAAQALQQATGATLYLDPADLGGDRLFPLTGAANTVPYPADGTLAVDELSFRFYRTPGHSRGGHCIYCAGLLFSGDTLFAGSCGRTDLPGGDGAALAASLALLRDLPLPDDTRVLPGHEGATTLGEERRTNPYMRGLRP